MVRRCHVSFVTQGVQLILADSWARPAILVAGKGREVMFLFLLFLHFHSCFSFFPVPPFHLFCYLFCLFSPFLWETTQNDPQGLTCRSTPSQSKPSLSTNRIIEYYRMYEWRAKAWITLCYVHDDLNLYILHIFEGTLLYVIQMESAFRRRE